MMFKEYPEVFTWYRAGEKAIYWPNGSITEFSHLGSTMDVYTYQGREYEDISIDEITQHEEVVFKILRSSNRTSNKEFKKAGGIVSMLLTGNPGGIGHGWAKRLFIDRLFTEKENPEDFGFVQAKVWDNKALMDADPEYVRRLEDLPVNLRRAYLEGDWDVFAGQVFSEFRRELHICNPVVPKAEFPHFLWIDWGYSGNEAHEGAFAGLAAALVQEKYQDTVFNRIIVYKEWYGKYKHPKEWAEKIYQEAPVKDFKDGVADSSMFNNQTDGSKPIAKLMEEQWDELKKKHWLTLKPGTKNRLARVATLHNWLSLAPDGLPYMLITESCPHLIRTMPLLVYDSYRVEDVDSSGEDHCLREDTLVHTTKGIVKISNLLGTEGNVFSSNGSVQRYWNVRLTGVKEIYRVIFDNGSYVDCTANHGFYTVRGKVKCAELRSTDMIQFVCSESKNSINYKTRIQWSLLLQRSFIKILQQIKQTLQRIKKTTQGGPVILLQGNSKGITYEKVRKIIPLCVKESVYNMNVESTHYFVVNGGAVVSNCYDALTYGLSDVKFINTKLGAMHQPIKNKGLPELITGLDLSAFEKAKSEKNKDWKNL